MIHEHLEQSITFYQVEIPQCILGFYPLDNILWFLDLYLIKGINFSSISHIESFLINLDL